MDASEQSLSSPRPRLDSEGVISWAKDVLIGEAEQLKDVIQLRDDIKRLITLHAGTITDLHIIPDALTDLFSEIERRVEAEHLDACMELRLTLLDSGQYRVVIIVDGDEFTIVDFVADHERIYPVIALRDTDGTEQRVVYKDRYEPKIEQITT